MKRKRIISGHTRYYYFNNRILQTDTPVDTPTRKPIEYEDNEEMLEMNDICGETVQAFDLLTLLSRMAESIETHIPISYVYKRRV